MIVFTNVTKKFPLGNVALKNVSFEIDKNEFVFLVGPSGAGKSTIINLILRRVIQTEGDIKVDKFVLDKKFSKVDQLRKKIGTIFQDFKLILSKNVEENILLSLKILGIEKQKAMEEVEKVLEFVGLLEKRYMFPLQLSAGEQQRVAIARALAGNRPIILADEPTGNLDPTTSWKIMEIFSKLQGKRTIIFATHNTDIVNSFGARVLRLEKGELVEDLKKGKYKL